MAPATDRGAVPPRNVSPQNGRPDAFSYSLPGNIRGGTLRFFTPEKTLATFNVDFDQRTMTRIDDEALSKNEGGSAAGR